MKGIFWKEGESFSNSMSLIAFLLVRYPEIGSVRFDPEQKIFQFCFVLTKAIDESEFRDFSNQLTLSLGSISQLQGREIGLVEMDFTDYQDLTFLEITRDIDSLTQEEIALIIGVVRQYFEERLLLDQEETVQEEDEIHLKDSRQEKKLIGFREEGRVLVFNRANLHK